MRFLNFKSPTLLHGLQLAGAVLLGYAVAVVLGLSERFWVVITVLIVMRADSGSTLDAGWDRIWGTLLGAASGLLGVYVQGLGASAVVVTLLIISGLAFASAAVPAMRSAAVAALIILAAGELPGYTAVQVALLRVMQIGIGVAVSVALVLLTSRYSTRARLSAGCAALLGRLALQLQTHGLRAMPSEAQAQVRSAAVRRVLQGLEMLASSADRRFPWSGPRSGALHDRHHRRIAALTGRTVQDSVILDRVLTLLRQQNEEHLAQQAANAAGAALASAAGAVAGHGVPSLAALSQLARNCAAHASAGTSMLAAPLRLLRDDLQQLCASVNGAAAAPAATPSTGGQIV